MRGKGAKAFLAYYWLYYKWVLLVILAVAVVGGSVLRSRLNKQEILFEAYFVNARMSEEEEEALAGEFSESAGLEKEAGLVRTEGSLTLAPGSQKSEYDLAAIDQIEVAEERASLDVLIADAWNFSFLTGQGAVQDLREVWSEEQLDAWKDSIYYLDLAELKEEQQKQRESANYFGPEVSREDALASEKIGTFILQDPSKMAEPVPVGIRVTDAAVLQDKAWYGETEAILGVAANSTRPELAYEFLKFLASPDKSGYTGE